MSRSEPALLHKRAHKILAPAHLATQQRPCPNIDFFDQVCDGTANDAREDPPNLDAAREGEDGGRRARGERR